MENVCTHVKWHDGMSALSTVCRARLSRCSFYVRGHSLRSGGTSVRRVVVPGSVFVLRIHSTTAQAHFLGRQKI